MSVGNNTSDLFKIICQLPASQNKKNRCHFHLLFILKVALASGESFYDSSQPWVCETQCISPKLSNASSLCIQHMESFAQVMAINLLTFLPRGHSIYSNGALLVVSRKHGVVFRRCSTPQRFLPFTVYHLLELSCNQPSFLQRFSI